MIASKSETLADRATSSLKSNMVGDLVFIATTVENPD